jgi:hypothetical protein
MALAVAAPSKAAARATGRRVSVEERPREGPGVETRSEVAVVVATDCRWSRFVLISFLLSSEW